jgi:DNA polymerase III delta prime subunit
MSSPKKIIKIKTRKTKSKDKKSKEKKSKEEKSKEENSKEENSKEEKSKEKRLKDNDNDNGNNNRNINGNGNGHNNRNINENKPLLEGTTILNKININSDDKLWVDKYRPKTLQDYYMESDIVETITDWIERFKDNDEQVERFLLLYGDPGIGKTTIAHIIFEQFGFDTVEFNASNHRTKKMIHEKIGCIGKYSVLHTYDNKDLCKKVGLIMDEIDGVTGGDKGAIDELITIINGKKTRKRKNKPVKKIKFPVICTCNSIKDRKMVSLIKESLCIKVPKPNKENLFKLGEKIVAQEKVNISKTNLTKLINHIKLDYRTFINTLYQYHLNHNFDFLRNFGEDEEFNDMHLYNDGNNGKPIDKIAHFLNYSNSISVIHRIVESDENVFFLNFYYNYFNILNTIKYFDKSSFEKKWSLLKMISDNIGWADQIQSKIFKLNDWNLMVYPALVGVVFNIKMINRFSPYKNNKSDTNINKNQTRQTRQTYKATNCQATNCQATNSKIINREVVNNQTKKNKSPKRNNKKHIFRLNHHTDYNKSCQELAINKKRQEYMWNKYEIEDISTLYYINKLHKINTKNTKNINIQNDKALVKNGEAFDINSFSKLFSSIDYHTKCK